MKEKVISTNSDTFYYIEVSQEIYNRILQGSKILDQLMHGDLSAIKQMAFDSYKERTGIEVTPDMQHNIMDCIRGLEAWGWNRPIEEPKRKEDESDLFCDIFQTLDHQQVLLDRENEGSGEPEHHCKTIPLIRILDVVKVKQKRNKPLRTFVDDYSKRRRI